MTKNLLKMFDRQGEKKKKSVYPGSMSSTQIEDHDLSPRKKVVYTEGKQRRAQQVGRVLYDHIVQLINSGELSPEIAGYALEIVKVTVVPDFSAVNVYWLSSGTEDDARIELLLKQHEGQLRHLLTTHYILGHIPRINFVRDDSRSNFLMVEALLSKADFGPEFTPTRLDTTIRDAIYLKRDRDLENTLVAAKLQEDFSRMGLDNDMDEADWSFEEVASSGETLEREDSTKEKNRSSEQESGISISSDKGELPLSEEVERLDPNSSQAFVPSSLEASVLGKQVLGESANTTHQKNEQNKTEPAGCFEGFRNDLYGVPHNELLNKVMARKNKFSTRSFVEETKCTSMDMGAAVEANALKSHMKKKAKAKERSVGDYQKAVLMDYHSSSMQQEASEAHPDDLDIEEDEITESDIETKK